MRLLNSAIILLSADAWLAIMLGCLRRERVCIAIETPHGRSEPEVRRSHHV